MFAVPDDLKLTPKNPSVDKPATSLPAGAKAKGGKPLAAKAPNAPAAKPNPKPAAPPKAAAPVKAAGKPNEKVAAIELTISEGDDVDVAWNDYFAAHRDVQDEAVRETARQLMHQRKFDQLIAMVNAALRNGLPQPWMYEAMGLAMQAGGSSKADIERALMSAIDLGEDAEDFMYVAQYMARIGLEARALKIFHQVATIEPLRPEPYLYGLRLAQSTGDLDGIRWSSLGILKQAWPKDKAEVLQIASRAAASVVAQLKTEKRSQEATEFQAEIDNAKVRDCLVKVTWTGDADIDITAEDPSGAVCSFRNPRTSGGGVLLGDAAASDSRSAGQLTSETYVCPEAFDGTYRVRVRRVWGKVTAGKVTVDVYSHYGSKDEKHLRHQVPLGDEDALIVFDLEGGRRKEVLAEHQLANAAAGQMAVNQAILAQQIGSMSQANPSGGANLNASRQGLFGVPFQQAVGYQPIIISLPQGANLFASGVVSADRRYVRVSPVPSFTGIGSVTTFNLQQGTTGTTPSSGVAPGTNPSTAGS